jgi:hypothetical protein
VVVHYVDGTTTEGTVVDWPGLPSHGVDWVEIARVRFKGKSVYWLYPEGDDWIAGCASFYEDAKNAELIVHPDGSQDERPIEWVPDLAHVNVKLGWWRPGTEGQPDG